MSESQRAVSELVGFVLIFAVVILSVALVTIAGYQGLDASREAERVNNAERGFDIFADNVDDVVRAGAPSRTTELKLDDADISLGQPVVVSVSGHPVGDPSNITFDEQYELRPLVYDSGGGSTVIYESGAVVRADRNGAVLLREPGFVRSSNETAITLIQPYAADASGVGGSGPVHLRVTGDERSVVVAETTPHEVTIEVTSPNAAVWEGYFEARFPGSCSRTGDTVACTWTTDRVFVTRVPVELRLD